jgi:hypothetical protein
MRLDDISDYCPHCAEGIAEAERQQEVSPEEETQFFEALRAEAERVQDVWIKARKPSLGFERDNGTLFATPHVFGGNEPVAVVFTWSPNESPIAQLPSPENECGRIRLDLKKKDFLDPLNEDMEPRRSELLSGLLDYVNEL